MPTFISFSDILPDPNNWISPAGVRGSGSPGPGFASASIKSKKTGVYARSRGASGVGMSDGSHSWLIDISYHKLLESEYLAIQSFLDSRNPRTDPFFVSLPQNLKPRNSLFNTYCISNTIRFVTQVNPGKSSAMIYGPSVISGTPSYGDMFNVVDPSDTTHMKTYRISRVEDNINYQTGTPQPTTSQKRIHFSPPLDKLVSINSVVKFIAPLIRVTSTQDTVEYTIDDDGLYTFSLQLEEALP